MLPPFIIEQIRRREEEERKRNEQQPRLELPLDRGDRRRPREQAQEHEDDVGRGVIVVDLLG